MGNRSLARSGVSIHVCVIMHVIKEIYCSLRMTKKKQTGSCYYHGLRVLPFSFRKKTSWVTGNLDRKMHYLIRIR